MFLYQMWALRCVPVALYHRRDQRDQQQFPQFKLVDRGKQNQETERVSAVQRSDPDSERRRQESGQRKPAKSNRIGNVQVKQRRSSAVFASVLTDDCTVICRACGGQR